MPSRSRWRGGYSGGTRDTWSSTSVRRAQLNPYSSPLEYQTSPDNVSWGESASAHQIRAIREILKIGAEYAGSLPEAAFETRLYQSGSPPLLIGVPNPPDEPDRKGVLREVPPIGDEPKYSQFSPEIAGIDKILFWRGAAKHKEARRRYHDAHSLWERQQLKKTEIEKENYQTITKIELAEHQYQAALEEWYNKRSAYDHILDAEQKKYNDHCASVAAAVFRDEARLAEVRRGLDVAAYFEHVLKRSPYPSFMPREISCSYDRDKGILVASVLLCDFRPLVEELGQKTKPKLVKADRVRLSEDSPLSIMIRSLHELACADEKSVIHTVVVNGWMRWNDPATGQQRHEIVASVQADRDLALSLSLSSISSRECFRMLKGVRSHGLTIGGELAAVLPTLRIDDDGRVIEGRAVLGELSEGSDLAEMSWDDFEHLVRELFAKEFAATNARVDVTRASRDWGVDAIIQDPDPIRGGKFVVQAKHYKNLVGADAVRELYGTVVNEGANRGILVTTSRYGAQSYEFAKGKPLTLLSGEDLIALLSKHGYKYRISQR